MKLKENKENCLREEKEGKDRKGMGRERRKEKINGKKVEEKEETKWERRGKKEEN